MRKETRIIAPALAAAGAILGAAAAEASISVELRPGLQSVGIGATVNVGVYAVSDSAAPQGLSATQLIISWQPAFLQMLSNSTVGAVPLISSGFPSPDPYGLNESALPLDGSAIYVGLAPLGGPVLATPAGTLLTTLRFTALAQTPLTPIDILASGGTPVGQSIVFDSTARTCR